MTPIACYYIGSICHYYSFCSDDRHSHRSHHPNGAFDDHESFHSLCAHNVKETEMGKVKWSEWLKVERYLGLAFYSLCIYIHRKVLLTALMIYYTPLSRSGPSLVVSMITRPTDLPGRSISPIHTMVRVVTAVIIIIMTITVPAAISTPPVQSE